MKRGTVVLVTGSRNWTDRKTIRARLERYPHGTILLHGGQIGADTIAAEMGREYGFQVVGVGYFGDLGKIGGPARNALLVDWARIAQKHGLTVYVEAFPLPQSKGTRNCIAQAKGAGLLVYENPPHSWPRRTA